MPWINPAAIEHQRRTRKDANDVIQALHLGSQHNDPKQTLQLDGQSAMLPVDEKVNITNYFNKGIDIQTQNETLRG